MVRVRNPVSQFIFLLVAKVRAETRFLGVDFKLQSLLEITKAINTIRNGLLQGQNSGLGVLKDATAI